MKGVSAVIAIILILMIVVALAALAWTWFSGIFSSLTATAETSVTQTTEQMAQNFVIESAYCDVGNTDLEFTIRNTGSGDIVSDGVAAYVGGTRYDHSTSSTIAPGASEDFVLDYNCGPDIGETLRATIPTGLAKTRSIEGA